MPLLFIQPYSNTVAPITSGDIYFDKVPFLMHMDGPVGTTTTTEQLQGNVKGFGGAVLSTTAKFGSTSMFIPNSTSGVAITPAAGRSYEIGNNDFTLEAWVYRNQATFSTVAGTFRWSFGYGGGYALAVESNNSIIFYITSTTIIQTAANVVPMNQWTHLAVTRTGSTWYVFVDGVQVYTINNATAMVPVDNHNSHDSTGSDYYLDMKIGYRPSDGGLTYQFIGYIDEVRLTVGHARYTSNFTPQTEAFPNVGSDPYLNNVTLLMHMDGAQGGSTFTDLKGHTVTASNVTIQGTNAKFGQAAQFTGSSASYMTIPSSSDFLFGSGDFTVEYWINMASIPDIAVCAIGAWPTSWLVYMNPAGLYFFINGGTIAVSSNGPSWSMNTWYHIAVTRQSSTWTIWVNGEAVATNSNASAITAGAEPLTLGINSSNSRNFLNGMMDDVRITKGVARYTSTFTPPTAPFPDITPA